jgi:hypothetical protein
MSESDSAPLKVVRRQLNRHTIALSDTDVVLSHLSGNVSEQVVPVFQLDAKLAVWKRFRNHAFH